MFLSDLSIKQPVFATMMMVALAVLGLASYRQLKVDQFPDVELPHRDRHHRLPGRLPGDGGARGHQEDRGGHQHRRGHPARRVHVAGGPLEHRGPLPPRGLDPGGLPGHPRQGGRHPRPLPREIEEPIVQRIDPNALPSRLGGRERARARARRPPPQLADKVIKRRLETVAGVGAVNLVGEATREIQVVVDRASLEAYHVSLAEVVNALRKENVDSPPGSADRGATEALVRVAARGRERRGDRPTSRSSARDAPPSWCATWPRWWTGWRSRRTWPSSTRPPALALDVQKQSGANTVAVADGVQDGGGEARDGAAAGGLPAGRARRLDLHPRLDPRREHHHDPRRHPDRAHRVRLPELLALHGHHRPHPAHLGDRRLHRHAALRLHPQRADPDGPVAWPSAC